MLNLDDTKTVISFNVDEAGYLVDLLREVYPLVCYCKGVAEDDVLADLIEALDTADSISLGASEEEVLDDRD